MIVASTTYESVLLVLKIAFLVLLYLFIWRIVRTAARDLRLPQESFILRPALAGGPIGQSIRPGRPVVVMSPVNDLGSTNGTFVNGIRIDRPRKLVQGDVIRVGETELRFEE